MDHDEEAIIDTLHKDPVFSKNSSIQIKKVSIAYNLDEYLGISEKVAEQKTLVKKMQFTESKRRRTVTMQAEDQDSKNHPLSISHENFDFGASRMSKPQKQFTVDLSVGSPRKKAKFDFKDASPQLLEQVDKLKKLNGEVNTGYFS